MASEHSLQAKIERMANLGSYEVDMQSGYWTGSENFIHIFGLPLKDRYTQKDFEDLVHPEDYEDVMRYFATCLEKQMDFNYEYRCIRPDGMIIHVLSRSTIEYEANGTPLRVIGMKQDITARKQAEMHINTLNELNKKKTKVMGMVAHDLRSPLTQIVGLAELLKDQVKEEEHREFLHHIFEACMSANDIITDLIDISEFNDPIKKPNKVLADINELVVNSVNRHRLSVQKKEQEVKTFLANTALAYVDRVKFMRVIDNLLTNAIKFSPKGETISVYTEQKNGNLIVKVKDHGIGIKPDHTPLLFEDDKSIVRREGTEGERSTGLGLTIVKQIIEMHDGDILVDSTEHQGTTFSVILPNKPAAKA